MEAFSSFLAISFYPSLLNLTGETMPHSRTPLITFCTSEDNEAMIWFHLLEQREHKMSFCFFIVAVYKENIWSLQKMQMIKKIKNIFFSKVIFNHTIQIITENFS